MWRYNRRGESVTEDEDSETVSDVDERGQTASEIDGPVRATSDDYVDLDIPLPWNTVSEEERAADPESENHDGSESDTSGDPASDGDDSTATSESVATPDAFEDLHFVGPKSAAALRDSAVSLSDFVNKRVSYRDLIEAGVNPGVAAKIRREHSLSWSFDGGGTDLDRRSAQVRGLADDERAWIAASTGWSEDGEAATETDGSGEAAAAEAAWRDRGTDDSNVDSESSAVDAETAWREQSVPTPVTALDGIDAGAARTLKRAGIGSIRRLATADPDSVAGALDVTRDDVATWRRLARDHES